MTNTIARIDGSCTINFNFHSFVNMSGEEIFGIDHEIIHSDSAISQEVDIMINAIHDGVEGNQSDPNALMEDFMKIASLVFNEDEWQLI